MNRVKLQRMKILEIYDKNAWLIFFHILRFKDMAILNDFLRFLFLQMIEFRFGLRSRCEVYDKPICDKTSR